MDFRGPFLILHGQEQPIWTLSIIDYEVNPTHFYKTDAPSASDFCLKSKHCAHILVKYCISNPLISMGVSNLTQQYQ